MPVCPCSKHHSKGGNMIVTTAPQYKPTPSSKEESLFRVPRNIRDATCLRGQIRQKQVNIILSGDTTRHDYLARLEDRACQLTVYIQREGRTHPWGDTIPDKPSASALTKINEMIKGLSQMPNSDSGLDQLEIGDIRKRIQTLQIIRPVLQKMIRVQKRGEGRASVQLHKALTHLEGYIAKLKARLRTKSGREYRERQFHQCSLAICQLVSRIEDNSLGHDQRTLIGWATHQTEPWNYPEMLTSCCQLAVARYREDQLSGPERSALQWANRKP